MTFPLPTSLYYSAIRLTARYDASRKTWNAQDFENCPETEHCSAMSHHPSQGQCEMLWLCAGRQRADRQRQDRWAP